MVVIILMFCLSLASWPWLLSVPWSLAFDAVPPVARERVQREWRLPTGAPRPCQEVVEGCDLGCSLGAPKCSPCYTMDLHKPLWTGSQLCISDSKSWVSKCLKMSKDNPLKCNVCGQCPLISVFFNAFKHFFDPSLCNLSSRFLHHRHVNFGSLSPSLRTEDMFLPAGVCAPKTCAVVMMEADRISVVLFSLWFHHLSIWRCDKLRGYELFLSCFCWSTVLMLVTVGSIIADVNDVNGELLMVEKGLREPSHVEGSEAKTPWTSDQITRVILQEWHHGLTQTPWWVLTLGIILPSKSQQEMLSDMMDWVKSQLTMA